jgi:hypothetical protein
MWKYNPDPPDAAADAEFTRRFSNLPLLEAAGIVVTPSATAPGLCYVSLIRAIRCEDAAAVIDALKEQGVV